jgi:hypothetical protein
MHAISTITDALETHFANLHLSNSSQAFASVQFAISAQPKKNPTTRSPGFKVSVPSFHIRKAYPESVRASYKQFPESQEPLRPQSMRKTF